MVRRELRARCDPASGMRPIQGRPAEPTTGTPRQARGCRTGAGRTRRVTLFNSDNNANVAIVIDHLDPVRPNGPGPKPLSLPGSASVEG